MINASCGSSIGRRFRVVTFGESHGAEVGCVIEGVPSRLKFDMDFIQNEVNRRRPVSKIASTARREKDKVKVLSGVFEGLTTGSPIALVVENEESNSKDYEDIKDIYRPGHADFTYDAKYNIRDYRGGGRASGRETVARVMAGAVAKLILRSLYPKLFIKAYTVNVGGIESKAVDFSEIEKNDLRAADKEASVLMLEKVKKAKEEGESIGGIVECIIRGCPRGVGDPVFNKLDALLSFAAVSIGSVKGVEFGAGFNGAINLLGSANNDSLYMDGGEGGEDKVKFTTNNSGGVLGGISTGEDIVFRVAVKATPSIYKEQRSVKKIDASKEVGSKEKEARYMDTTFRIKGRHDVCLCPRVVPVVEAMSAIVLADLLL